MKASFGILAGFLLLLSGCASDGKHAIPTLADLQKQQAEKSQVTQPDEPISPQVRFDIDRQALIESYRDLVAITPFESGQGKELQRLADLELEQSMDSRLDEQAATAQQGERLSEQAILRYQQYLERYPGREDNDLILYQLARAYDIDGKPDEAQKWLDQLVQEYPESVYRSEVQFRRAENLFVENRYREAEQAYRDIVDRDPESPFYDKALYKQGWARFKQNQYRPALDSFVRLLDLKQQQGQLQQNALDEQLGRADRELLQDALRVVSLSFSYLPQRQPIATYFNRTGKRSYEPLLYRQLAQLYASKDRTSDATAVYLSFAENYPFSRFASRFHQRAIELNQKAGFSTLVLAEKKQFVEKYNRGSAYWQQQTADDQKQLKALLTRHMFDIATHYHALARAGKKRRDYQSAALWYRKYIDAFPSDKRASEINFLLAEALFDARQYSAAISEYEKTAYQYPAHNNSAEAGYAALLAYRQLLKTAKKSRRPELNEQYLQSALTFSQRFPEDPRMASVLLNVAQQRYQQKQYQLAANAARDLIANPGLGRKMQQDSWLLLAQSSFQMKDYAASEEAWRKLISLTPKQRKKQLKEYHEQLAASIYKQGEAARTAGQHRQAADLFVRASKIMPGSKTAITAQYDAATEMIALQDWTPAIALLESFRKQYPRQKQWRLGVSQKLALAYNNSKQYRKAAKEMLVLARLSPKKDRRELEWQSTLLYEQAGDQKNAIQQYKIYIKKYPYPLTRSMELRDKLAQYYLGKNNQKNYRYWLREIVKADAGAKKRRTDRSRYLAAVASLKLIQPTRQQYSRVKLTRPLKKSLKRKKQLMKQVVAAYGKAAKYQVEEVTTEATYQIAEIYREFAEALLKSERPTKLDEDALEEYNYMLEDQAYPFEEKAIKIHQTNLSRIPKGSYDDSIKNSLQALARLMPFRYAKSEKAEDYVE